MRSPASTLLITMTGLALLASAPGCSDSEEAPRQVLPVSTSPNFVLYVSNQSFDLDPVDIEVRLDGELAVEGDFLVEGQHSWHTFDFELAPGSHELRAVTRAGETVLSETVEIADRERYGVLDFWYYPPGSSSEPYGPAFSFDLFDEPPVFD
ncbi:MAG TPA: hypothetical protein VK698_04005 [Kofleriaceae bacterium]|nr:hypothetical protein [Kofleriaceae bacterium]